MRQAAAAREVHARSRGAPTHDAGAPTHDDERTSVQCEGARGSARECEGAPEYLRRRGSREWASGARLQVPGRAAAGAGERSCSQRGADDARAAAGTHARGCCAGVHGANTVRRRGARVRRPLVGAGPPGSSWCPS